jgi:MinD-like ATPase involved in chromosome partitioning or flagellar assembly
MRHIHILNAKGGSGETTIATNLAPYATQIDREQWVPLLRNVHEITSTL